VSGGDGSLRDGTPLGARRGPARPRGSPAATEIRQAKLTQYRPAEQERRRRRGGDLRDGEPAEHALRAGQDGGTAVGADAAPDAGLLVKLRSMLANALHAHLGEYGIASTQGIAAMRERAAAILIGEEAARLPALAGQALKLLARQFLDLDAQLQRAVAVALATHQADATSRRLASIPGIGPVTASALVASIGDVGQFRSGRELAAWLGLTPKQNSSGGKDRLAVSPSAAMPICAGCWPTVP